MLGYDKPLYLMAFDHRGSFEHDLFGATEPVSAQVRDAIIAVKEIVFGAHRPALAAGAPPTASGALVEDFLAGHASRTQAVERIAARYRDVIDAYHSGEAPAASSSAAIDGASR